MDSGWVVKLLSSDSFIGIGNPFEKILEFFLTFNDLPFFTVKIRAFLAKWNFERLKLYIRSF
jgi:hypothetical protein